MNNVYGYDIEIVPNYAAFMFIDMAEYMAMYKSIYDPKEKYKLLVSESEKIKRIEAIPHRLFEISSIDGYEKNDILALLDFINQDDYLCGFNILNYDNTILHMLAMDISKFTSLKDINKKLYMLSKKLVETDPDVLRNDTSVKLYKFYTPRFKSIDIQRVPALDKVFKSLKQTLINLSWHAIDDLTLPPIDPETEGKYYQLPPEAYHMIAKWDRYLLPHHVPRVTQYHRNDVLGVCHLFCFLEEQILLRFNLNARYGIDVLSASDSRIADIFISKYYSDYTGIDYREYKDLRTHRTRMKIGPIISPLIKFQTKEFNNLHQKLLNTVVSSTDEINFPVDFNGVTYDIKSGGLHSRDLPKQFFEIDGESYIRDGDVGSYYPSLTQNMMVAPAHLDKEAFLTVTKIMVDQRLEAKAAGDKVVADSLKITINVGLFGKFNFAYSFLFDTLCTLTITINGQLMLLMLIERLALKGIPNVSANTDGIVCIIPADKLQTYYDTCDQWAKEVNFLFEYTEYIKYIRLDVNNYITVKRKKDGKLDIKRKGGLNQYLQIEDLKKGFNKPIIPKAVEEYFINGTPVGDTIRNERNIYLFCATQNMDSSYTPIHRSMVKGKFVEKVMQKNVRFFVSNKGGVILKKKGDKYTSILKKTNTTIFNDYFEVKDFNDYDVNYTYYINEARKLIAIIESGVKGNKKKDINAQSNRFMNSLFDDDVMDGLKITRKEGDMELVNASEIAEYLVDDDDNEPIPKQPRVIDEDKYNNLISDKEFDGCDGYGASLPKGEYTAGLDKEEYLRLCQTDEDDLPF